MKITPQELRERAPVLSVGMLSANLLQLEDELETIRVAGVDVVHIDVMDGVFCPQISVGTPVVRAIPDNFVKDVHLMVDEPLAKVSTFVEAGASLISFHLEATRQPHRVLQSLEGSGVVRGLALNPGTPVSAVEPLLDELDLLLLLTVNPGRPGQTLAPNTGTRVAQARALVGERPVVIGVDGGVTLGNAADVAMLAPDLVVAGSAVFDGVAPGDNARALLDALGTAPASNDAGSLAGSGRLER